MNRRALLAAVGTTAAVAASGCLDGPIQRPPPAGEAESEEPDPSVEILESTLNREDAGTDDERVWISGTARRAGETQLSYVEIRALFFDVDGEQLDSTVEHIEDPTADSRWSFEIEFSGRGEQAAAVDDYELEVITAL